MSREVHVRFGEQRRGKFPPLTLMAIFVSSERSAQRMLRTVSDWIEKYLKVSVNREKSGSGPADTGSLLGFRLYANGRIGVSPKAGIGYTGIGAWAVARSRPLHQTLSNATLLRYGFTIPWDSAEAFP